MTPKPLEYSLLNAAPKAVRDMLLASGVYGVNDCFMPLYTVKASRKDVFGGRGSGKSHHITDYADWLLATKPYCRVLFLRYIREDVRGSIWQSFLDGLELRNRLCEYDIGRHEMKAICRRNGNMLACKGMKASKSQSAKLKSLAGYTHIFIEEADEAPKKEKQKLIDSVRKKGVEIEIVQAWNTANKQHHIYDPYEFIESEHKGYYRARLKPGTKDYLSIHSTYKDNLHNLNEVFIRRYKEAAEGTDIHYYLTDVQGLIPSHASTLIFSHFKKFDVMPACERYIWGIDYGYTNDPTAIVKVGVIGRKRYCQELLYQPGVSAERIMAILYENGWDEEQPLYSEIDGEMILQLRILGVMVRPKKGGPGSKRAGIAKMYEYECFYNGDNFEKEIETWQYVTVTDLHSGETVVTNEAVDKDDHLCQATIYACYTDSFYVREGY